MTGYVDFYYILLLFLMLQNKVGQEKEILTFLLFIRKLIGTLIIRLMSGAIYFEIVNLSIQSQERILLKIIPVNE